MKVLPTYDCIRVSPHCTLKLASALTVVRVAAERLAKSAFTSWISADFLCRSPRLPSAIRSCPTKRRGWHADWATPACHAPCWTPTWHTPWPRHGCPSHDACPWHECLQVCSSIVHADESQLQQPLLCCLHYWHLHKSARMIDTRSRLGRSCHTIQSLWHAAFVQTLPGLPLYDQNQLKKQILCSQLP